MTVQMFLMLLTVFSTVTSLITQGVKAFLDTAKATYSSNIVALYVAIIVGAGGTAIYYLANGVEWTALNIVCIGLMALANWLGAMLGYDKVKQAITQINKGAE